MKLAIIGQSAFGADVYKALKSDGHDIVGVFTIPDNKGKEDILATTAKADGTKVFKIQRWKALKSQGGELIPEVWENYKSCGADLNVLAYVTQFIPMEVCNLPKHGSIIYHPSLLPAHRGASAINWTLMSGDKVGGFTIFFADEGLDTGPILLQKNVNILPDDTVNSLYKRFLFPEGVKGISESVKLIQEGKAPKIEQPKEGVMAWNGYSASYDPMWTDKKLAKINWSQPAEKIHNFIRGSDRVPGAWTVINGEEVTLYGSTLSVDAKNSTVTTHKVESYDKPLLQTDNSLIFEGSDGVKISISQVQIGTRAIPAGQFGKKQESSGPAVPLGEKEKAVVDQLATIWKSILSVPSVNEDLDFFSSGAGSMDVTRLISNVSKLIKVDLIADDVFMNPTFSSMFGVLLRKLKGDSVVEHKISTIDREIHGIKISMPHQAFINNQFVDSISGKLHDVIDPTTEEVICKVSSCEKEDVDKAVAAAVAAFDPKSTWRRMNARDRGLLMYRLADLMEKHKEELASIESLNSGAVYTLALKTHVGMSIETFRYFAGWCDKIEGKTIPINNARPSFNLCYTKREPIGPCSIVIPWNYPLMMLAWKTAACLAAGNTVVIKPAQVTPLTALKWAQLALQVGFPPGVVNIVPGSGKIVGEALAGHLDIRKLGFTGSTQIGARIMEACAQSNVKKCSLELGGKSPLIIFADCELDRAVRLSLSACFFNKGENCIAAGRLFVEESIHDKFVEQVVAETRKMVIGDPFAPETSHGPQNHKAHLQKLLNFVERGVKEGAKLVYGGKRANRTGLFFEPTIMTDVDDKNFIAKEESFGPIMIISKFDGDVDKVLKRANDTEFGLSSGVFTKDINKALRIVDGLEAGTCYINTYNKTDVASSFGGFKQSGFGKDLGEEALNEYLKTKTITVEYS